MIMSSPRVGWLGSLTFQVLTRASVPVTSRVRPFGRKTVPRRPSPWAGSLPTGSGVPGPVTVHRVAVAEPSAVTKVPFFGLTDNDRTGPWVRTAPTAPALAPVDRSHVVAAPFSSPASSRFPSELNTIEVTAPVGPVRVSNGSVVGAPRVEVGVAGVV